MNVIYCAEALNGYWIQVMLSQLISTIALAGFNQGHIFSCPVVYSTFFLDEETV